LLRIDTWERVNGSTYGGRHEAAIPLGRIIEAVRQVIGGR